MVERARSWLVLTSVLLLSSSAWAANWPQWRGPDGHGISPETAVPLEWSADRNIAWKTPIPGRGHSQPIVWNDRIFLTTAIEGPIVEGAKAVPHTDGGKSFLHPDSVGANRQHTFKVLSLDVKTGRILWERDAWRGTPHDDRHKRGSHASATPVTDGKLVYAWFGSEGLYAYDFDGNLAWKKDLGGLPTLGMGTGTSPILYRNLIILQCDEDAGEKSFIVALDKRDGREVWRTPRKVQVSWSTPVVATAPNGRDELITNGTELQPSEAGDVFVVRAGPKHEVLRTNSLGETITASPAIANGRVYLRTEQHLVAIGS